MLVLIRIVLWYLKLTGFYESPIVEIMIHEIDKTTSDHVAPSGDQKVVFGCIKTGISAVIVSKPQNLVEQSYQSGCIVLSTVVASHHVLAREAEATNDFFNHLRSVLRIKIDFAIPADDVEKTVSMTLRGEREDGARNDNEFSCNSFLFIHAWTALILFEKRLTSCVAKMEAEHTRVEAFDLESLHLQVLKSLLEFDKRN